jgi:hypothetical protein
MSIIKTERRMIGGAEIAYGTMLLNVRHGEYHWGQVEGIKETVYTLSAQEEEEGNGTFIGNSTIPEEHWEAWKQDDWGTVILIEGPFFRIVEAFQKLAAALMPSLDPSGYTPGGDDDFFDYWPGGMECLREFAIDLRSLVPDDGLVGAFYAKPGFMGVYRAVQVDFLVREYLRNVKDPGQRGDWVGEIIEDHVKELATDCNIKEDNVIHYISDLGEIKRHAPH